GLVHLLRPIRQSWRHRLASHLPSFEPIYSCDADHRPIWTRDCTQSSDLACHARAYHHPHGSRLVLATPPAITAAPADTRRVVVRVHARTGSQALLLRAALSRRVVWVGGAVFRGGRSATGARRIS